MSNNNRISIIIIFTFLIAITTSVFAQKCSAPSKYNIEKSLELIEILTQDFNKKEGISYTVLSNISQKDDAKEVRFNLKLDKEQQVMIEIFNTDGDLIEVVYNDSMKAKDKTQFVLDGHDWTFQESYFLRVTTDDFIEHHEIVFKP